jgi:imidazole glycerol-phosphate synthase subunit HisH
VSIRVAIVDYGMGNIGSVQSALQHLGVVPCVSHRRDELAQADAFILPGVGAFGAAMENLIRLGLPDLLREQVLEAGKPLLGICLGMQLLAQDSTELGFHQGLGWIPAHVLELDHATDLRVPHVGWSPLQLDRPHPMFDRMDQQAHFYFDHSFHFVCDPQWVTARCDYGVPLVAAVQRDHVFATQFHPEKSQRSGLKLLRNFLRFVEARAHSGRGIVPETVAAVYDRRPREDRSS